MCNDSELFQYRNSSELLLFVSQLQKVGTSISWVNPAMRAAIVMTALISSDLFMHLCYTPPHSITESAMSESERAIPVHPLWGNLHIRLNGWRRDYAQVSRRGKVLVAACSMYGKTFNRGSWHNGNDSMQMVCRAFHTSAGVSVFDICRSIRDGRWMGKK